MNELVDKDSASKLVVFVPPDQKIAFARKVSLGNPPMIWLFFIGGIFAIVAFLLSLMGVIELMPNTNWAKSNLGALVFFTLWTAFVAWSIKRKRSGDAAITSENYVFSLLPEFRRGRLKAIRLKNTSQIVILWKVDAPSPFHFPYSGEPLSISTDDADGVARLLSDQTGIPITKSNGFVSMTVYQPQQS